MAGEIRASRFGLSMTRPVQTLAGADRASTADGLAVGNEWVYGTRTSKESQLLWVIPSRGTWEGPRLRVRITRDRELLGRHVYDGVVETASEPDAAPREPQPFVLYAWDGAVYVDGEGEPTPWLTREDVVDADGTVGCTSAIFPGATCRCTTRGRDAAVRLPGPASCTWSGGSAISTAVTVFLAIVTVGLVIEDPNPTHHAVILVSGTGETGEFPG